jgi:hypothetical protein
MPEDRIVPAMNVYARHGLGRRSLPLLFIAAALMLAAVAARAEGPVKLSITIEDHKFVPPELHAQSGKGIEIHVGNLNPVVSEFESADLHFEKIIPAGSQAVVYVRALRPGKYVFYDDFHRATQGYLVVP